MKLVSATMARLPERAEIVAAFDTDPAGRQLAAAMGDAVANMANKTGRSDLIFKVHLPAQEGADWNNVLQNQAVRSQV